MWTKSMKQWKTRTPVVTKSTLKDLNYYLSLPYGIYLKPDEDGTWFAEIPQLPGCMTYGDSRADALEMIEDAKRVWIQGRLDLGYPVPEPEEQ